MKATLIEIFRQWGRPTFLRVDNGLPFGRGGAHGEKIPPLVLWAIGTGIYFHWNRPYRATDNAKVERMQGVTAHWAEPGQCRSVAALERQLNWAITTQRCRYPVRRLAYKTRQECFPELFNEGDSYEEEGDSYEEASFDYDRVWHFLATGTWQRRVGKQGQIKFWGDRFQLGTSYARQYVSVVFDPETIEWVVRDECGHEIKRIAADTLRDYARCEMSQLQRTNPCAAQPPVQEQNASRSL